MVAFKSYGDGKVFMNGAAFWGLVTAVLAARINSGSWLDTTGLTNKPARTLAFFLIGASISCYYNFKKLEDLGYDNKTYNLHRRVA